MEYSMQKAKLGIKAAGCTLNQAIGTDSQLLSPSVAQFISDVERH